MYLYKSMREKYDEHIFLSLKDSCVWLKRGLPGLWPRASVTLRKKNHSQNKFQQSSLTKCPGRTQIITQTLYVVNYQAGKRKYPCFKFSNTQDQNFHITKFIND